MAQRNIEILIGRLMTDEAFRLAFFTDPAAALRAFIDTGHDLTPVEVAAVLATDQSVWSSSAELIDARLQKLSVTSCEQ